jgi:hypothetical protein
MLLVTVLATVGRHWVGSCGVPSTSVCPQGSHSNAGTKTQLGPNGSLVSGGLWLFKAWSHLGHPFWLQCWRWKLLNCRMVWCRQPCSHRCILQCTNMQMATYKPVWLCLRPSSNLTRAVLHHGEVATCEHTGQVTESGRR